MAILDILSQSEQALTEILIGQNIDISERYGSTTIPNGFVGVGTVCSITLNGILLRHGIPTTSRFGGLLDLKNGVPTRFSDVIHYDGTSIDPLVVFIRSGMADYIGGYHQRKRTNRRKFPRIPCG